MSITSLLTQWGAAFSVGYKASPAKTSEVSLIEGIAGQILERVQTLKEALH